jgi:hypothetical protein
MRTIFNPLRNEIQTTADKVKALLNSPAVSGKDPAVAGEIRANIMLSFRHLEDARMRLGKAIQAAEGGVSIYDAGATDSNRVPVPNPNT